MRNIFHNMRGENDNTIDSQAGQQISEADSFERVQSGCRFVHNQHFRGPEKDLCQANPSDHPAGEIPHGHVSNMREIHHVQGTVDCFSPLFFLFHSLQKRDVIQVLAGCQGTVDAELLREVSDLLTGVFQLPGEIIAQHGNIAPCGLIDSG